jgi:hypothetical protein
MPTFLAAYNARADGQFVVNTPFVKPLALRPIAGSVLICREESGIRTPAARKRSRLNRRGVIHHDPCNNFRVSGLEQHAVDDAFHFVASIPRVEAAS